MKCEPSSIRLLSPREPQVPALTTPVLYFSEEEFNDRIARTRAAMEARGIELLIVSDPSNMAWLTGYDGWSFYVHQCVVLSLEGQPVWFGRGQDGNGARRTCFMSHDNIIGYPDHYVQSVERHGLNNKKTGVEMDNYWFSAAAFASLQTHMPNATLVDATALVNWQRAVKSEQELGYMRTAGKIVEKMHQRIVDKIEPGIRKCDLVADIYDASLRFDESLNAGGDYPAIVPLLPSGPTVFLGKPTKTFVNAEKAVLEGMDAGLEVARAGNTCEDIAIAFFKGDGDPECLADFPRKLLVVQ